MSRTDHHAPDWVLALHAHTDGRPTVEIHSSFCADRTDPATGRTGPARDYTIRFVDAKLAAEHGWEVLDLWGTPADFSADSIRDRRVYARVPEPPHACDIDTGGSKCRRYVDYIDRRRRYRYTRRASRAEIVSTYFAPERRAVRDALRNVVREANAAGTRTDRDEACREIDWRDWEPDAARGREAPTRQHRHAVWGGGWWD